MSIRIRIPTAAFGICFWRGRVLGAVLPIKLGCGEGSWRVPTQNRRLHHRPLPATPFTTTTTDPTHLPSTTHPPFDIRYCLSALAAACPPANATPSCALHATLTVCEISSCCWVGSLEPAAHVQKQCQIHASSHIARTSSARTAPSTLCLGPPCELRTIFSRRMTDRR